VSLFIQCRTVTWLPHEIHIPVSIWWR